MSFLDRIKEKRRLQEEQKRKELESKNQEIFGRLTYLLENEHWMDCMKFICDNNVMYYNVPRKISLRFDGSKFILDFYKNKSLDHIMKQLQNSTWEVNKVLYDGLKNIKEGKAHGKKDSLFYDHCKVFLEKKWNLSSGLSWRKQI